MEDKGSFTFYVNETKNDLEVYFFGEIKAGAELESERFKNLLSSINDAVFHRNKPVYLNVENVTYWDSMGMKNTIGLALQLNSDKSSKVATMVGSKDGWTYKVAKEKYSEEIGNAVLWKRG